jgi:hypothetical protein
MVHGGQGLFISPAFMINLEPGRLYWLGGFWDRPVEHEVPAAQPGAPLLTDLGTANLRYYGRAPAYSTMPGPGNFTLSGWSSSAPYRQLYSLRATAAADLCPESELSSVGTSAKGNIISVDAESQLETIGIYLSEVPEGTRLCWSVYFSWITDGFYQKKSETCRTVAGGDGYFYSDPIDLTMGNGYFYWIGATADQPVRYHYSNRTPLPPLEARLASSVLTYQRRMTPYSTIEGPNSFNGNPDFYPPYRQRYLFSGSVSFIFADSFDSGNLDAWSAVTQ